MNKRLLTSIFIGCGTALVGWFLTHDLFVTATAGALNAIPSQVSEGIGRKIERAVLSIAFLGVARLFMLRNQ